MNTIIGNPLDLFKEYGERKGYRRHEQMTEEECRVIINLAVDNGDWNGIAVNYLKISSAHANFIEGDVSFGDGATYYFSIGHDAAIDIHPMEFDEKRNEFKHGRDRFRTYCCSHIVFYMMRQGFDLHSTFLTT